MLKTLRLILHMAILITVILFTTVMCVFAARGVGSISEFTISYISPYCFLVDGTDVNLAMKKVVNSSTNSYTTADSTIQHIVFDFWDDSEYGTMFNWDTSSSRSVDAAENANIRLFYNSSSKTMYVLSYNLIASSNSSSMFQNFTALQSVDFKNFNSIQSVSHENMFYNDTSLQTLSHIENLSTNLSLTTKNMFYNCTGLSTLDTSNLRTETITSMSGMFKNCSGLSTINTSHFHTEKVTDFSEMFSGCSNLSSLNLSSFSTTYATTMRNMFYNCTHLSSLDFSTFDTTRVTTFEGMFYNCTGLSSLDLSTFNSVNATTFKDMFYNCSSLSTLDISNLVSDLVTNMSQMFAQTAISSLDLSKFDTSNVTNMEKMFYNMPNITTIYASNLWTTMNVTSSANMFTYDTNLVGGFGTTYSSSYTGITYAHVDVPNGAGYLTAADVQYKGLFINDEYGTQLSVSYVGTNSPYTLPTDAEYDHLTCNSTNYQPGATVNYNIFDGVDNVVFVVYYKKATLTFTDGTNGSYVSRSATYTHKGYNRSVSSGGSVPWTAVVTITLSTTDSKYTNPLFSAQTSSGQDVALTTISQYEQYSFTMPNQNVTATFTSTKTSCIAQGTMITLADGSKKPIEELSEDEQVLVLNHETGAVEACEINFIESDGQDYYNIVNLVFSNGSTCRIIYEHGFFDATLNKYIFVHEEDYQEYIGHDFYVLSSDGQLETATLVDAYTSIEYTGCYSLITKYHINYFVDGLLSMPGGVTGLLNIFEYGENLQYDPENKASLIAEFGLFEYEDFKDFVTYEEFCLYPAPYLKVSLGRGLITWKGIVYLIERYC